MSSATERLRAMLDERGVEHFDGTETTLWGYEPTGESTGVYRFAADETSGGRMQVRMFNLAPEQAIEATLGRGECKDIGRLEEENAKLRELVSDLWSDLENQLMPPWSGEYERRIRELGIEVTP